MLKPGRELDALVAEKVMEWQDCMLDNKPIDGLGKTPEGRTAVIIPNYSTNIAAAWEVVEKMRNLGWFFDLNFQASYTAMFRTDYLITTRRFEEKEETAPHAICLGALKAVGAL